MFKFYNKNNLKIYCYNLLNTMDYIELLNKNNLLEEKIQKLNEELFETQKHLKKYTAPLRSKCFTKNIKKIYLKKKKTQKLKNKEKK